MFLFVCRLLTVSDTLLLSSTLCIIIVTPCYDFRTQIIKYIQLLQGISIEMFIPIFPPSTTLWITLLLATFDFRSFLWATLPNSVSNTSRVPLHLLTVTSASYLVSSKDITSISVPLVQFSNSPDVGQWIINFGLTGRN